MRSSATRRPASSAFQSAPDREVGRCLISPFHVCLKMRFNPRPTVRSGDAAGADGLLGREEVSIRARP